MAKKTLYRVTAPSFCAGFICHGKVVTETAPILAWMKNMRLLTAASLCSIKGWEVEQVLDTRAAALERPAPEILVSVPAVPIDKVSKGTRA